MNVIELDGLHKKFGKKKVLNGLSLDIEQGSILGFVGENRGSYADSHY